MAWTYLLRCSDGSYYVGSTKNLPARLDAHQQGRGSAYTRHRLSVELVWSHEIQNVAEAFGFEKQVQNWSRAKREALIDGRLGDLPALAWGYPFGVRRGRAIVVSTRSLALPARPPRHPTPNARGLDHPGTRPPRDSTTQEPAPQLARCGRA